MVVPYNWSTFQNRTSF